MNNRYLHQLPEKKTTGKHWNHDGQNTAVMHASSEMIDDGAGDAEAVNESCFHKRKINECCIQAPIWTASGSNQLIHKE